MAQSSSGSVICFLVLKFLRMSTVSVEFVSNHNNEPWILTNIYAPCTAPGKRAFLQWFKNINMPNTVNWLIVGDFNLYRNPDDRNKPGDDHLENVPLQ